MRCRSLRLLGREGEDLQRVLLREAHLAVPGTDRDHLQRVLGVTGQVPRFDVRSGYEGEPTRPPLTT